jgi:hypothetical protein
MGPHRARLAEAGSVEVLELVARRERLADAKLDWWRERRCVVRACARSTEEQAARTVLDVA